MPYLTPNIFSSLLAFAVPNPCARPPRDRANERAYAAGKRGSRTAHGKRPSGGTFRFFGARARYCFDPAPSLTNRTQRNRQAPNR